MLVSAGWCRVVSVGWCRSVSGSAHPRTTTATHHHCRQDIEVFHELQALWKKDASTLAFAIRAVVLYVTSAALEGLPRDHRLRVVHLLTGDGINTNMAAARRVFRSFQGDTSIDYRVLVWRCASHQVNLVVHVAICGSLLKDPVNSNGLCGTCSRLFKYLINDYFEEFSIALQQWVASAFRVTPCDAAAQAAHRERVLKFRALYGEDVVPETLVQIYNLRFDAPEHCSEDLSDAEMREMRGTLFRELQKRVLLVEEHPIVTRFWLFAQCVRTLLLAAPLTA